LSGAGVQQTLSGAANASTIGSPSIIGDATYFFLLEQGDRLLMEQGGSLIMEYA
jgi:hypothetical protein